jgi:hypothetical protein
MSKFEILARGFAEETQSFLSEVEKKNLDFFG